MAHYLIELYSPTDRWLGLNESLRRGYLDAIGAGMVELGRAGVEVVAMGEVDRGIGHCANQRYFAVWKLANRDMVQTLASAISESGWHELFDTVNAAGEGVDFGTHLVQLKSA